ncbi:MAG: zinc-binding dehydrogenase [Algoriphagus sp.]|jgi:zinc-binding alcohol dehydrogenase/oxidoreductase|uniref:quinone oxidoreductase family protein n=1 Tax=Algoriphagus sp. TaxID=1872435 RepID=UPI002778A932|nr:zinc-binding dehydrogenase [Algoriphagus sp.]MDP4747423.1 zinc-binding dehydrogenase [Algoriphagus sp.]MDP4837940.1 zinc-binding dehydrogenase [Algoriphagus sp.]MDP4905402.1 zinc-binding dehydrogenase [Algoriphagus sp.]MDP4957559.1 zinc-binding dehydrogenase [Algoriphagus sp.]
MKGIVLQRNSPSKIQLLELPQPVCGPGEVLIRIKAAALNHRDEWCRKGLYPNLKDGVILGSDGAGIVVEVGAGVDPSLIGEEVLINPAKNWGINEKAQSKEFEILGMPSQGTLAEFITVPADRIHPKPNQLSWEEAAALPLAGLTAYRALVVKGQVQAGDQVLVTGIGGGVAQFVAQFALALGAKVFVSSSAPEKISQAIAQGASAGFNYTDANWSTQALQQTGGIDLVIDGAAGDTLTHLMDVCNPGARLVFYGATRGNPGQLEARKLFWNQLQLIGTTMGSDANFLQMLQLVKKHQLKPILDQVFPLEQAVEAFDRMKEGRQFGKIVLVP